MLRNVSLQSILGFLLGAITRILSKFAERAVVKNPARWSHASLEKLRKTRFYQRTLMLCCQMLLEVCLGAEDLGRFMSFGSTNPFPCIFLLSHVLNPFSERPVKSVWAMAVFKEADVRLQVAKYMLPISISAYVRLLDRALPYAQRVPLASFISQWMKHNGHWKWVSPESYSGGPGILSVFFQIREIPLALELLLEPANFGNVVWSIGV